MAQARLTPSKVLVPRPISSRMMKLFSVAALSMEAVSAISTKKVDLPPARLSLAPTRVKIRSVIPISQLSAGTYEPMWASRIIRAFWRRKVDFPAMFGPVMR